MKLSLDPLNIIVIAAFGAWVVGGLSEIPNPLVQVDVRTVTTTQTVTARTLVGLGVAPWLVAFFALLAIPLGVLVVQKIHRKRLSIVK